MAIQWLSAVLTSVGNTPFALALGFDGIETKLWLISQIEAPPINAIEGAFSASVILIALVVPCDQNLLGRLSFDSVGRALRPNSGTSI